MKCAGGEIKKLVNTIVIAPIQGATGLHREEDRMWKSTRSDSAWFTKLHLPQGGISTAAALDVPDRQLIYLVNSSLDLMVTVMGGSRIGLSVWTP